MSKETYIPCLLGLFRQYGYDGATLAKISQASGLGKASLYHHFPGGKDEMVRTVLEFLEQWLGDNIVVALRSEGDAQTRFRRMADRLDELYDGGEQPCIFAVLLLGSGRDLFHGSVQALFQGWIATMAEVLVESGLEPTLAQQRAEDGAIAVQGSLILAQALADPAPFRRTMAQLPAHLCRPVA